MGILYCNNNISIEYDWYFNLYLEPLIYHKYSAAVSSLGPNILQYIPQNIDKTRNLLNNIRKCTKYLSSLLTLKQRFGEKWNAVSLASIIILWKSIKLCVDIRFLNTMF